MVNPVEAGDKGGRSLVTVSGDCPHGSLVTVPGFLVTVPGFLVTVPTGGLQLAPIAPPLTSGPLVSIIPLSGDSMDIVVSAIDFILHVDKYLVWILQNYGGWTYAFAFVIFFCETGLVVTPFLPGDSVIFALAALAARGGLDIAVLAIVILMGAVLGNAVNYLIGFRVGPAVFRSERSRFFNREYLARAHAFYEKYGGITIIAGRFMPIIRTFVPFVAGIARMNVLKFYIFNLVGAFAWVGVFLSAGFFFGQVPFVEKNFSLVTLAIIFVSFIPPVVTAIKVRGEGRKKAEGKPDASI
jgi:membrane-associated protein